MLLSLDIEPEGRSVIAEGLQKTTCLRDLQTALTTAAADAIELDFSKLVDVEVKAAAGFFFGLCRSIDVDRFPKTFQFCFFMVELLNAEFEQRRGSINAN